MDERLQVCAVCRWSDPEYDYEDWWFECRCPLSGFASTWASPHYRRHVEYRDRCHYTPSQWQPFVCGDRAYEWADVVVRRV
jgi:hypothetical protein